MDCLLQKGKGVMTVPWSGDDTMLHGRGVMVVVAVRRGVGRFQKLNFLTVEFSLRIWAAHASRFPGRFPWSGRFPWPAASSRHEDTSA